VPGLRECGAAREWRVVSEARRLLEQVPAKRIVGRALERIPHQLGNDVEIAERGRKKATKLAELPVGAGCSRELWVRRSGSVRSARSGRRSQIGSLAERLAKDGGPLQVGLRELEGVFQSGRRIAPTRTSMAIWECWPRPSTRARRSSRRMASETAAYGQASRGGSAEGVEQVGLRRRWANQEHAAVQAGSTRVEVTPVSSKGGEPRAGCFMPEVPSAERGHYCQAGAAYRGV